MLGLWLLPALLLPAGGLSELCLCLRMFAFAPCCAQVAPGAADQTAAPGAGDQPAAPASAVTTPDGCCSHEFAQAARHAPTRSAPVAEDPGSNDTCTMVATPRTDPATPPAQPIAVPGFDAPVVVAQLARLVEPPAVEAWRVRHARAPPRPQRLCLRPGALPLRL